VPDGRAGDEIAFVRELQSRELDVAVLTTAGLDRAAPDTRALDLPLLFASDNELDAVRRDLAGDLDEAFARAGLVRLANADTGAVHVFMASGASTGVELKALTHWSWADDPLGDCFMTELGSPGKKTDVAELLPSLQRGEITAVLSTPLVALAMQLHQPAPRVSDKPVARSVGALVMRTAAWEKLSAATQRIVREESQRFETRVLAMQRPENARAMSNLISLGVQTVRLPDAALAKAARVCAVALDDKLYSKKMRLRVEAAVAAARKK
jgi:TRAP-type C4-dicarboxylate transport system substrate-binding protein